MLRKQNSLNPLLGENSLNNPISFPSIKTTVSRDISHIKDSTQPVKTGFQSTHELLQSILSPDEAASKESKLHLRVQPSTQKGDRVEEQFYFTLESFIEEDSMNEGLFTYRQHTRLVIDTLFSMYGISLSDIKNKYYKSSENDRKMTIPTSRREVELLSN